MKTYKEFLYESSQKKIVVYHGSPYKFKKFSFTGNKTMHQHGSEYGFFFTFEKKLAEPFALSLPSKEYNRDYKKAEEKNKTLFKQEYIKNGSKYHQIIIDIYSKIIEEYETLSKERLFSRGIFSSMKSEYKKLEKNKGTIKFEEVFHNPDGILKYIKMDRDVLLKIYNEVLSNSEKDYFTEYRSLYDKIRKKYEEKISSEVNDKYTNQPGYIYTCEVSYNKLGEVNGEDVGVGIGRTNAIFEYMEREYDGLIIKNADTGGYIGDELIIFDEKNIKIEKIEKIYGS